MSLLWSALLLDTSTAQPVRPLYNFSFSRSAESHYNTSFVASVTESAVIAIAQPLVKAAAAAADPHSELKLFSFNWDSVKKYLVVTTFLLIAIVIKILHANVRLIHTYLPESCLLILCGISIGFLKSQVLSNFYIPQFSIEIFFYLLIPPIMLEAAFSLHDRVFFENLGTILSYAVIGTLLNIVLISASLYFVSFTGIFRHDRLTLIELVVFSTIISAIDPVAVLTIFEEININKDIYFLVFGESLLNDAVVITLYNTVVTLKSFDNLGSSQVGLAASSFLVVSLGGALCGLILGLSSSIAAKYCQRVRVVEPLLMLVFAYFSYVIGELFHLSGIISLICCGLAQAQFARLNISRKSFITVRYITKTMSALADNVIFIFLGMLLVQQNHLFNPGFFTASFGFAVCHRFVSIYFLSYLSNRLYRRARMIRPNEQFLIAYGGLRGAIAFSLAFSMPPFLVHRQLLTSSTLQLVVASVFIFGCTMKPLVRYLKIRSDTTPELSLLECMQRRVQLYTLSAIENLIGQRSFNAYAERYVRFNEHQLRPMLVSSSAMHNQLAVELRFMLEQLYVKHTAPHTDRPPLLHSQDPPGTAVRLLGQSLFNRVRRFSSLRRFSGGDKSPNHQKRRATDEAVNAQRAYSTAPASLQHQMYSSPIQMPKPPPPNRSPTLTPTLTVKLAANGQPVGAATLEQQIWMINEASGDLPKNSLSPWHASLIAQQQQMNKNLSNKQQRHSIPLQTPEQMQLLQLPTEDLLYLQRMALGSRFLPQQVERLFPLSDQDIAALTSPYGDALDSNPRRVSLESGETMRKRNSQIEEALVSSLRKSRQQSLHKDLPIGESGNDTFLAQIERTEPTQVTFKDDDLRDAQKSVAKKSNLKSHDTSPSNGRGSTLRETKQKESKTSKHHQRKTPKRVIESSPLRQHPHGSTSNKKSQQQPTFSVRIDVPESSNESSKQRPRASNYSVYQELPDWRPPRVRDFLPRPTSAGSERGDSDHHYRSEQDRIRKKSAADVQAQLNMLTYNSRLRRAYKHGERSKFERMQNQE